MMAHQRPCAPPVRPEFDRLVSTACHDLGLVELHTIDAVFMAMDTMRLVPPVPPAVFQECAGLI